MKQRIIIGVLVICGMLAGCGPVDPAVPTTPDTTTTTNTLAADLTQDNNRPLCAGLFNVGSCNVVQVNAQRVNRPAGSPAPAPDNGMTGAGVVLTTVLLCLGFIACMFVASIVMGNRGYN